MLDHGENEHNDCRAVARGDSRTGGGAPGALAGRTRTPIDPYRRRLLVAGSRALGGPVRGRGSGAGPMTPKKPRGRPSKFNETTRERVLAAVRAGAYLSGASAFAGVSPSTVRGWYDRGR